MTPRLEESPGSSQPFVGARWLALAALLLAGPSLAEVPRASRAPPPEAIAACQGRRADQACSFVSKSGTLQGVCWSFEGKPLACRPKDAPPGQDAARLPPR